MMPMLAGKFVESKLQLPVYVQPKYDGIRCLVRGGTGFSRTIKPIPNQFIQEFFAKHKDILEGYDGELIVGRPTSKDVYRRSASGIMSEGGTPNFTYYVFDHWQAGLRYQARHALLCDDEQLWPRDVKARVVRTSTYLANSLEELMNLESQFIGEGYEGAILRHPDGIYKGGRSTSNEGYLLKLKRFLDAEAKIVGFEELYSNQNPAEFDNLGHTVRSLHKANQVPMNTLGSLICEMELTGNRFGIGSGFDQATRREIWINRESYFGKTVKFKYVEVGGYDVPRFPIFLGFRHEADQ